MANKKDRNKIVLGLLALVGLGGIILVAAKGKIGGGGGGVITYGIFNVTITNVSSTWNNAGTAPVSAIFTAKLVNSLGQTAATFVSSLQTIPAGGASVFTGNWPTAVAHGQYTLFLSLTDAQGGPLGNQFNGQVQI